MFVFVRSCTFFDFYRGSAKEANGDSSSAQKDVPSKEPKVDAVCELKLVKHL